MSRAEINLTENFKVLTRHFKTYLQTLGFSKSIVYNYPKSIELLLEYLQTQNIKHINQVKQQHISGYFNYLEGRKAFTKSTTLSIPHLNKTFDAVDKFLEYLHVNILQSVSKAPLPTKHRIKNDQDANYKVLSITEVKQLYDTIQFTFDNVYDLSKREPRQQLLHLVLNLCYGCGLRRREAFNLKIDHINFDGKTLIVRQGKNYKDRIVPMSKNVFKQVQNFVFVHRKFFTRRAGFVFPYSYDFLPYALKMILKVSNNVELKSKSPTLHTLRHSIATHLLQNGMSISNIAKFLGHSSLESTQIYTHLIKNNQLKNTTANTQEPNEL